jgi:hypothetical protein
MAQELRIGANEVLLSLAPEYRTADSSADATATLLGAVQRFKPFIDLLTAFKAPAECELTTVVVKNVGQIGTRISSVVLDVTLRNAKTKAAVTQPVLLDADTVSAVVLPVIDVVDSDPNSSVTATGGFAVLFPRARLALGSQTLLVAPVGFFSGSDAGGGAVQNLQLTNGVTSDDLASAGFRAQHLTERMCTPLAGEDIVTGYEGQAPVRVFASRRSCTAAELQELIAARDTLERPFVLVPLEDVAARTTDINAILAASLLL